MPNQFQKSLQECLPKMKKPITRIGFRQSRTFSSSTSWILRGCKHPKTMSFACDDDDQKENEHCGAGAGDGNDGDAATLSDIDRFLLENFKSLYKEDEEGIAREKSDHDHDEVVSIKAGEESPGLLFKDPPASHRFFVTPGSSSSLMEEAQLTIPCTIAGTSTESEEIGSGGGRRRRSRGMDFGFSKMITTGSTSTGTISDSSCSSSSTSSMNDDSARTSSYSSNNKDKETPTTTKTLNPDDFITVLTYSNSPYDDFKKSMQEMIEARLKHNGRIDWEFMEELLFCFLNLNDKKSYRFILRAFVDMIIFLRRHNRPTCKPADCSIP